MGHNYLVGRARIRYAVASSALAALAITAGMSTGAGASVPARSVAHASAVTLTGAGSTFDQPFFTLGFYEYQRLVDPNVTVNLRVDR